MSFHCSADVVTVALIFRTIISVNQLSFYGAVSDWCGELAQRFSDCSLVRTGKPVAKDKSEAMMAPADVSTSTNSPLTDQQAQGDVVRAHRCKFANLPVDIRIIRTCSDAGFMKAVSIRAYIVTVHTEEKASLVCSGPCREYTLPRNEKVSRVKGDGFEEIQELVQYWKSPRKITMDVTESK